MRNRSAALLLAAALAAPALAQPQPPAPPEGARAPEVRVMRMHRGQMFGNVSLEGREILREAMGSVTREDRAALRAARDRINAVVAAERLDMNALRAAMAEERRLVDAHHAKRQAALLAALPRLSAADRKAFAEDARAGRDGMEARTAEWRKWAEEFRARMRDMPPPPPPPVPPAPGIE